MVKLSVLLFALENPENPENPENQL